MSANLSKLSARALEAKYERLNALSSANCTALINAGRGMEKPVDICAKTDPLSLEYIKLRDAFYLVVDEMNARKRWHGSLKPIPKSRCSHDTNSNPN